MRTQEALAFLLLAGFLPTQLLAQKGRKRGGGGDSCARRGDDALDPLKPDERADAVRQIRIDEAKREYDGSRQVCQRSNDDHEDDGSPILAAKFHKTLPHDRLGQVDPDAFRALRECVYSGDFEVCEAVPAGDSNGYLINPLGGVPVDMAGPAGSALSVPPAPGLESAELAGQMAECYWMSLTRDVPFSQYGTDSLTKIAAENLAAMPGFPLAEYDVAMNSDGSIDPARQLFRASFTGVDKGPMISQLLVNSFTFDSITVDPKMTTCAKGIDYLTDFDSWLHIQNGGAPDSPDELDGTARYIRSGRDLARLVATDTIFTEAFRGTMILMQKGGISGSGFIGPYERSTRQKGFVQYGASHVMRMLGEGESAQRASWYQKWNVHMMLRPEALGGLVHNVLSRKLEIPIHKSLLENEDLLSMVWTANEMYNEPKGKAGTYLLSQAASTGSPSHPSYPAGHAVQNGAFATMLKAMCGLEHGKICFPDPMVPDDEGLKLLPYEPADDEFCYTKDGEKVNGLSFDGEINKLAVNVAFGRGMMGVHYRFDSTEGMILGETVAVRLLHQEIMEIPEVYALEFALFRGNEVKLFKDGSFMIDGVQCSGPVYNGVENC